LKLCYVKSFYLKQKIYYTQALQKCIGVYWR